jgi:hypothetical protein
VCGAHNLGVLPLGGPVVAGDQAHAVQAPEVAEHEGVAGLRLLRRTVGEGEVPAGVLLPPVGLEKGVLLRGAGLDIGPAAAHPVPASVDQLASLGDARLVDDISGHGGQSAPAAWRPGRAGRPGPEQLGRLVPRVSAGHSHGERCE